MCERAMTDAEVGIAPDWQTWAMDCLTDEQLFHCGHLGESMIVEGCEFCGELLAHLTHEPGQVVFGCEWCGNRMCTCPSARWTAPGREPYTMSPDCARHGKKAAPVPLVEDGQR